MTRSNNLLPILSAVIIGLISLAIIMFLVLRGVQKPQNSVPSHAAGTTNSDPTKCQGNSNPDPRCYDCAQDKNAVSQIGIIDFGCFSRWYGKNVGTP